MLMERRVLFAPGGFGAKFTTLRIVAKTYRPYVPEQDLLLPPSLRDWLPEGHLAFFVSDLVEQLDLSAILRVYEDDERGYPPYHPVMLTKVLVYGYEAVDAAEDAEYGGDHGDELPAELQRRESRLQRIREAKRALEARSRAEAGAAGQPTESAKPDPTAQYNFTDPESRIMKGPDGFMQAYNVQVAVNELQLIVAQAVTQATNDKHQLLPMITTIAQQAGDTPSQVLADAGYCPDENLAAIATTGIDAYISTRKQKHGERPRPCPRGPLPKTATRVERMTRKLLTNAGAAVYARRKTIVEPVLGQIKQARGFRQFLLRGVAKVQGEWALVCTTHNILKLYRLCT